MNRGVDQLSSETFKVFTKDPGHDVHIAGAICLCRGGDCHIVGAIKYRGRDIDILVAIFGKLPKLLLNQTYTLGNLIIYKGRVVKLKMRWSEATKANNLPLFEFDNLKSICIK